jgi:subtilisin family serine protease
MKFGLGICLMMFIGFAGFGQEEKIDPELLFMMESGMREPIKITVSFEDKVDFEQLKQTFTENQVPVKQRPGIVMQQLLKVAQESQKSLTQICIQRNGREVISFDPFWIVNMVYIECEPSLIYRIASLPEVSYIDQQYGEIRFEDPFVGKDPLTTRSPGIAEPGLHAINAHRMWELGYTGRGRLVYNYDTGVWPDHPAFRDRYLGKRFPESQAWIGYSSPVASGEVNDHGTHVLGTIAGLVQETDDTLGVATGAYWIANDFVGTRVEGLPPISEMINAFEWAFNPDGDINTSYDVPDVINNSWRWYDAPDQEHCGPGLIVDLMNAIEAAGIANIFAGGNFGPANTTISSPQRINTSKVNTFSVGSVNANLDYPYPISSFSSRGPTQCPGSDFERIHPQVVAPGEDVRSAWGTDGYNTISGTSMATPHVSGAVLLLKEAFPDLPGDQLLWALYRSAIDYGESGEDNTFGNGLIDVYAAFELLSQSWQPADPQNPEWDLSIEQITGIESNGITCADSMHPVIHCTNKGINKIDSFWIYYWLTGESDTTKILINNELDFKENLNFALGEIVLEGTGVFELNVQVLIPGVVNEYDFYNNRLKSSVKKFDPVKVPFSENFETAIAEHLWYLNNPDFSTTWETIALSGHGNNQYAASMQFFNYSPREKQIDQLVLHNIEIPSDYDSNLSFDLAYAPFLKNPTENRDTLRVLALGNCEEVDLTILYEKAGEALVTHNVIILNFEPQHPGQWRKENISLKQFAGSVISLVFETVNLKWNNLYIDNILIDSIPAVNIEQISADSSSKIRVFPNPAHGTLQIELYPATEFEGTLNLLNAHGVLLESRKTFFENRIELDVAQLPAGYYMVQFVDGNQTRQTAPFIKISHR